MRWKKIAKRRNNLKIGENHKEDGEETMVKMEKGEKDGEDGEWRKRWRWKIEKIVENEKIVEKNKIFKENRNMKKKKKVEDGRQYVKCIWGYFRLLPWNLIKICHICNSFKDLLYP